MSPNRSLSAGSGTLPYRKWNCRRIVRSCCWVAALPCAASLRMSVSPSLARVAGGICMMRLPSAAIACLMAPTS
eukprot:3468392-Amphidinium_carterae.1